MNLHTPGQALSSLRVFRWRSSMERSPNACSGNKALKYAIFETAIANNFFTNSIDFCSVMVSFGNIPVKSLVFSL